MNLPIAIKENWVSFAKYMFLKPYLNIRYVSLSAINCLIWVIGCTEWMSSLKNNLTEKIV